MSNPAFLAKISNARAAIEAGTMTAKEWDLLSYAQRHAAQDRSGLSPQLNGLEGYRVEVLDECGGDKRRFNVGVSTGWHPCHLEVHNARSMGGDPARKSYFAVRVIRRVR